MNIQELTHKLIKDKSEELRHSGQIDENFRVLQCLIKLPKDEKPIVDFNLEIGWYMRSNTAHMSEGQQAYIWDLKKVTAVEFPKHKGDKVSYIFFYYTGFDYSLIFDFSPNSIKQDDISDFDHPYSRTLANYYNLIFTELAIKQMPDKIQQELIQNNYFMTTSIVPYPINLLSKPSVKFGEYIEHLISFFDSDLIGSIMENWSSNEIFNNRKKGFMEAIDNYKSGKYQSCISVLVPQIEGVLREFLYLKRNVVKKTNAKSAFNEIEEIFKSKSQPDIIIQLVESFSTFFNRKEGFFESFNKWTDSLSDNFISRHAHSHGKYKPEMYSKENSIRLFLMLYTFNDMINVINKK